jgi:opacity protein-like surface antigen
MLNTIATLLVAASAAPAPAPVARITVEESLAGILETDTDFEVDFDQFDPANGTLSSIQVGVKVTKEYTYDFENTSATPNSYGIGVANGTASYPFGFDEWDTGVTQGSNYQRVVMSRDGEYSFAHSNYQPLLLGRYGAYDTHVLTYSDVETDYTWSSVITDASVLSAHTGTGTVKVSFDANYLHGWALSGGQSTSLSHTLTADAAIRYNY